jgi:hypothetical protein
MILTTASAPPACYASVASYYKSHHERGPFHTTVVTDSDYAFVSWYGTHSGGQGAFRHRGSRWCLLFSSGGTFSVDEMVGYGVPRPVAERLTAKMQRLQPK